MQYEDSIDIIAPVDAVWGLTVDIERWPEFTPTMKSIRRLDPGDLRVGSRARVRQPAALPAVWTVTCLDPPTTFEWQTQLPGTKMTAGHRLEATGEGCRSLLTVRLEGGGAALVHRLLGPMIRRSIRRENRAFQRRAEESRQEAAG